jgi:hypothetical protein
MRPARQVAKHLAYYFWPRSPSLLFTFERYDEFYRSIRLRSGRDYTTSDLLVAPVQRTVGAIENDNHTPLGSFDAHFQEALEKGRSVEIK